MCDEINRGEIKQNFFRNGNFYIYGDIDETIPERIINPLIDLIRKKAEEKTPEPINVFISSDGGDLHYALEIISIFEMAKQSGVQINTIVNSQASSAASLIAVCGHKRVAQPWSSHLIHFSKQIDFSHNPEMAERNAEYTKFINKEMVKIYKSKTKIKDIEKKLLADNYMINGENLKKLGLVDIIIK